MVILIIDDEKSTRESLKILTGFGRNPECTLYEAANGRDGYEMILAHRPDLVFLDMNMSVMDGTDVLRLIEEKQIRTNVIVVSGYTDFKYVQAAVSHRCVVDYVQKPIDGKLLHEAVEKAIGETLTQQALFYPAPEPESQKVPVGLFVEDYEQLLRKRYNNLPELFRYALLCEMKREFEEAEEYIMQDQVYAYAFFFTIGKELPQRIRTKLDSMAKRLERRDQVRLYAVFSEEPGGLQSCHELCEVLNFVPLNGVERVFESTASIPEERTLPRQEMLAEEWIYEIREGHVEEAKAVHDRIVQDVLSQDKITVYDLKLFLSGLCHEIGKRIPPEETEAHKKILDWQTQLYSDRDLLTKGRAKIWLESLSEWIGGFFLGPQQQLPTHFRQILRFVQRRYNKKISLAEVAGEFHFNISTVSRMFVRYTGVNFVDYLNTIRLEHAKHFLELTDLSVSEIAAETGFESLSYFSRRFRKEFGTSPQEYRMGHQKAKDKTAQIHQEGGQ